MNIRRYVPTRDERAVLQVWNQVFMLEHCGGSWPMTPAWFHAILDASGEDHNHLVAESGGKIVAFALAQAHWKDPRRGSLMALAVHPGARRQGIGRSLYQAALSQLQARGVARVLLGAGSQRYFWPGVPVELTSGWAFFQAMGWSETGRSVDMARPLADYFTPAWVWDRVRASGLEFVSLNEGNPGRRVVEFVTREQPGWAAAYNQAIHEGRYSDVLVCRQTASGELLAACLIERPSERWAGRMAQPVGAPGCILTAEAARGRGIGMALTARATEIVQARGCHTAFLGWTWLVDWYGKLGYKVWQEYRMSEQYIS